MADETPFFFRLREDRLFSVLHPGASRPPRHGIVLCHAFAEERLWAHRVYVNFARDLAAAGIAVLRFDFRGEGDSDLDFEQATLASRVEDALRAAEVLLDARGLDRCVFLGHRLGAAIAALAAARAPQLVEAVIAWDPIDNGPAYLMQLMRVALAAQYSASGRAPTRAALLKALEEGRTVVIDGYGITPELYRELNALEWSRVLREVSCPVLAVEGRCEPAFWRQGRQLQIRAATMTARTHEWLQKELAWPRASSH